MPLLKRGPEIFPSTLFDSSEDPSCWFVAHTRSRQEKVLARHLESLQVPFYLPSAEHVRRREGRRLVSYLPLFPGYVFLRGAAPERALVMRSHVVVRLLDPPDPLALQEELSQLRRLQLSGAELVPGPTFAVGDAVRVTEGPFRGYRGVVLRMQGRLRLVVSISMLRQSVVVELDRSSLSAAEPRLEGSRRAAVA